MSANESDTSRTKALRRYRPAIIILVVAAIVLGALLFRRAGSAKDMISIGKASGYRRGTATDLSLNATIDYPVGSRKHPVPVWVVNDAREGLIVFLNRSTHLGCRLIRPDDISYPSFEAEARSVDAYFVDPCGGSFFSYSGRWLKGPAPRGLDRFLVTIDQNGTATVQLKQINAGPAR